MMGIMQMCTKHPMFKASHWDAWHRALFYDEHTGKFYDLIWHDITWLWYDMISSDCDMTWYHVIWSHIIWYRCIWNYDMMKKQNVHHVWFFSKSYLKVVIWHDVKVWCGARSPRLGVPPGRTTSWTCVSHNLQSQSQFIIHNLGKQLLGPA